MPNYGDLKARINDDLGRNDLATQIVGAIDDAIEEYQDHRFTFNETILNGQAFVKFQPDYDLPSDFLKLDTLMHVDVSGEIRLKQIDYDLYRDIVYRPSVTIGQPTSFAIYGGKFHFYPTPDNASDTYSVHYLRSFPALVDDADENPWTNQARQLIRARAKAQLYRHVIRNVTQEEIARLENEARVQLNRLQRQSRRSRSRGQIKAHC